MLSNRPYLLRAFHEWIQDSSCTPILVLDVHYPRCQVPRDFIDGDEIVFNVSNTAVRDLKISNDSVEFKASFSGVIHIISAPIRAVLALYAEENGEGIFFDSEEENQEDHRLTAVTGGAKLREVEGSNLNANDHHNMNNIVPPKKSKPFLKLVE